MPEPRHTDGLDANRRQTCTTCRRPWPCPTAAQQHTYVLDPTTNTWEPLCH